ncbi:SURF1 family protein [Silvimonas iriomotensis]|uniref:SURF1-like protein n=1 Tax=Silvimonas iriomotensis TaxID=449662 RepID=A0ABQ2PEL7_9NEIS|nr:SURF1 family protein [Silvimonas iriomotensis]GGP23831.1 SURF1-like protein [Silvimonas iriomotensis]
MKLPAARQRRGALVGLAALVLLTVALGIWQAARAVYKQRLADHYAASIALPPLTWASHDMPPLFRRLSLQGYWLSAQTLYLDHRDYNGEVGVEVVTPFRLSDGSIVLINRGWRAAGAVESAAIPATPQVEVLAWPRFFELAHTPPQGRLFQNITAARFAEWSHLPQPMWYGRLRSEANDGLQHDSAVPDFNPARHIGYMLTWWGMSIAGLFLWRHFRRSTRAAPAEPLTEARITTTTKPATAPEGDNA